MEYVGTHFNMDSMRVKIITNMIIICYVFPGNWNVKLLSDFYYSLNILIKNLKIIIKIKNKFIIP
jgi:hypothetical protein